MTIKNVIKTSVLGFLMMACGKDSDGFKTAENGVVYKFYTQKNEGTTPKEGDLITISYTFMTKMKGKDSVFLNSKNAPNGVVEMPMPKVSFKGSMEAGMMMMHQGDSAVFKFPLDSFFLKTQRAQAIDTANFKPGNTMYFTVKMIAIKPKAEFEKDMAEKQKKAQEMALMAEKEEMPKMEAYLKANNITTAPLASGLIIVEKVKGTGKQIVKDDSVYIRYTGKLLDGTIFDSSEKDGRPPLGTIVGQTPPNVIAAWEEALLKLKVGSEATIVSPSKLAYGAQGGGPIPPFGTLVFDFKVVSAKPSK
jgi:FKBP-type peptidyl-prolyl cis-trans isomerase FkpA